MASFIKISTSADVGTGKGLFINPEKVVFVQSDSGDPATYFIRLNLPTQVSNVAGPVSNNEVYGIGIDIVDNRVGPPNDFPFLEAVNEAIETALNTDDVVVDVNLLLIQKVGRDYTIDGVSISNP
tara:strand:+ start:123 stop:497 length:375 start_codon:yes stop_codon:yes gene_type:complete